MPGFPFPRISIARLLTVGVPGLALFAIAGAAVAPPFRAAFQAELLAAVVVFVVSATLALALARLTAIGHDGGFDWRRNPAWIGLVLVVLAVAITATVALTTVGASLIQVLAGVTVGVLVIVALSAGLERGALKRRLRSHRLPARDLPVGGGSPAGRSRAPSCRRGGRVPEGKRMPAGC